MRVDLDVRRQWRCDSCGAERRTSGDRTTVRCSVCAERPLMSLVERPRLARPVPPPLDLTISLHPDDVDSPPTIPADVTPAPPDEPIAAETAASEPEQPVPEKPSRSGKRQSRRRARRKSARSESRDSPKSPDPATPSAPGNPETFGDGVLENS